MLASIAGALGVSTPGLRGLAQMAQVAALNDLSPQQVQFLNDLTAQEDATLYTDSDSAFSKYTRDVAETYLAKTRETHRVVRAKLTA